MTFKLNNSDLNRLARKYRNRASDAGFVDRALLKSAGMDDLADLAWQVHNDMCKLFNAIESAIDDRKNPRRNTG
jgi:hypothetical protein